MNNGSKLMDYLFLELSVSYGIIYVDEAFVDVF